MKQNRLRLVVTLSVCEALNGSRPKNQGFLIPLSFGDGPHVERTINPQSGVDLVGPLLQMDRKGGSKRLTGWLWTIEVVVVCKLEGAPLILSDGP